LNRSREEESFERDQNSSGYPDLKEIKTNNKKPQRLDFKNNDFKGTQHDLQTAYMQQKRQNNSSLYPQNQNNNIPRPNKPRQIDSKQPPPFKNKHLKE